MNKCSIVKNNKAITLVALVVTIVVLLILAGVSINLVLGDNGLIKRAQEAANSTRNSTAQELSEMDRLGVELGIYANSQDVFEGGNWNDTLGICTPKLGNNMVGVYWSDGTKNSNGTYQASMTSTAYEVTSDQNEFSWAEWYNYRAETTTRGDTKLSRWANAKSTVDGSYFVWIPRYEYAITEGEHTSTAGKIVVNFINTSTPQTNGYKIHPAFSTNLELGGWDKEICGIWVAKYEMSMEQYADGSWSNVETNGSGVGNTPLTSTLRAVSKPNYYAWNYITITNCFDNSLNYSTNSNTGSNSHLMKNSEWGAVAYLTHSQYGRNGNEIGMNTYYKDDTNYAKITGYGGNNTSSTTAVTDNNRYNGTYGLNASTTGNLYGVYDISGGNWEYTSGLYGKYTNGTSLYANTQSGTYTSSNASSQLPSNSSKLVTIYPMDSTIEGNDGSIHFHYATWSEVYGDAIYETSSGTGSNKSWFNDYADEDSVLTEPFFIRGGGGPVWLGTGAGVFAFGDHSGGYTYNGRLPLSVSLRVEIRVNKEIKNI